MIARAHVNLLIADLGAAAGLSLGRRLLPLALAAPVVLLLAGYLQHAWTVYATGKQMQEFAAKRDALRQELVTLTGELQASEQTEAERADASRKQLEALRGVLQGRIAWSDVLREVSFLVPDGLYLTALDSADDEGGVLAANGKRMRFAGFAPSHAVVTRFIAALEASEHFAHVALVYAQQGEATDRIVFEIGARVRGS